MKKKELMRRLSAISIAAMVTVTTVPSTAFAADVEFSDGGQETVEVQADEQNDAEVSVQDDADDAGDVINGETSEVESSDAELFSAEEDADTFAENAGVDLFEDGTEAAGDADADAKAAATEYLKKNYVDSNKIISNGGTGVVKSEGGLSYSVGLKMPSGSSISSIRFKTESSSSSYKSGWYISSDCPWVNLGTKKPSNLGSLGINRPGADQGAQSFKVVLRLFSSDTTTDTINDEAQASTVALAEQDFTITIESAEPNYTMTVRVQDEEGNAIDDAAVTLEKNWSTVYPKADGSYDMEKGAAYTLTVKKDGYNDYKESYFTFNPTEVNTVKTVTLKKIVTRNVKFNVTDQSGNPVSGATVTVKKGWYDTIKPEADGSYNLIDGTTYKYSVEAPNYKSVSNQEFIPDKDDTINVQLEKNISNYTVTINPVDKDSKTVENASIKVTYEEEDPWDEDETETVELKANDNGTYTMKKGVTYTYTVTAPEYKEVTDTYTPSGDEENVSVNVTMVSSIDPADVETVNAIKAQFDKEGAMRPNFAKDKNIVDVVKAKISIYDIDTTGVTISVKSSEDTDWVDTDGTIHYNKAQTPDQNGINFKNVSVVYVFEKNGAKAETEASTATICWDRDYFNTKIEADKDDLTWDKIKGSNTDAAEITSNLTLPQCLSTSARNAWTKITWTSSNESVISFKDTGWGSLIDAKEGVINPQPEDTEVTLTATFNANDTLLNSYVEKVSDFATLTKEFKVTVKGTGAVKPTEDELLAILDKYYTEDQITNFNDKDQTADLKNCTYDLQLPRYTRIKDEKGEYVFNNKEITVTSDKDAIKVNGYRASVDRFASNEDITANLIVTFTRDDVTVTKKIPVTVKAITEAEVQDQLDLMEYAKAHYFDGINDGLYADKDSITGNLHPFQELTADKKWIYNNDDKTSTGIIPDDQFTDPWEMEGAGYNKFKSSNNAVVGHENLVVTRRETDTQITISSVLSSELYQEAAKAHPDNAVLQKLYKQPVSVTVTIKGTKSAAEGLQKLIDEAQTLLEGMTEGSEEGQYPEGTKAALQTAVDTAKEVLNKENVTEKELNDATLALQKAIDTAKDAQNENISDIKVRVNLAGKPAQLSSLTVSSKDAAKYGYKKSDEMRNQVTVADALYDLHKAMYGDAFETDSSEYLVINASGIIEKIFGEQTYACSFYVNNEYPTDESGMGTYANATVLQPGDELSIYMYADTTAWSDVYLYFQNVPDQICVGREFQASLYGKSMMSAGRSKEADCTVALKNITTGETTELITDAEGAFTVKADKAGKYQLEVTKTSHEYFVAPLAQFEVREHAYDAGKVTKAATCTGTGIKIYTCTECGETKTEKIPAAGHKYVWKTISTATVFQPAKQQGKCSVCGKTATRNYGTKLKATVKMNVSAITLQQNQKTKRVRVILEKGDSVRSWVSSNKKIVTVDRNGLIKAQNRNGRATITITTKSGLKKTLSVKVQKGIVTARKIVHLNTKETIKKGKKMTLKPWISPLTCQEKVTYASSNSKVATVSSKGVITAKKKGTAKITVKCGKQSYVVKVTVK